MITVNGKTRLCGLIGNPVEHTLSPLIHNTLSEKLNNNLVYVPFLVEEGQLPDAIKGAKAFNILGLNVTVPYKSDILEHLAEIDPLAQSIGAVNTLVSVQGGYKGFNTDMTGLLRAMKSDGIQIKGENIIILGAGGAARAVAFLCASNGAKKVYLMNRTMEKAGMVAEEVNRVLHTDCIIPMSLSDYISLPEERFLAIQATSVGLYPKVEEAVITETLFYKKIYAGYDLIYKPEKTRFMSLVEENGGDAFNGLKMLLFQGIEAYELWNQISVSEELANVIYEQMKKELGKNE